MDCQACPWDIFFCPIPSHPMAIYDCSIPWDSHYNINMEYSSIKIIKFMKITKINRKTMTSLLRMRINLKPRHFFINYQQQVKT